MMSISKKTGNLFMRFAMIAIALFSTSAIFAATPDFSIPEADLKIKPGTTQNLHINLANAKDYCALQFDLKMPAGLTVSTVDAKMIIAGSDFKLYGSSLQDADSYRFLAYAFKKPIPNFSPGDNLITLEITANNDFSGGAIEIFNAFVAQKVEEGLSDKIVEVAASDKSYEMVANVQVESISLDKTSVTITDSESVTLKATITPLNASGQKLTWSSSNDEIASVDQSGVVTGKKKGTATITVSSENGKSATCTVTVTDTPATSVTITQPSSTTLNVGESIILAATVAPANATVKTVTWTSSKTSVATVDQTGKVTAVGAGSVEITATCGSVSGSITLTVHNYIKSIQITPSEISIELDKTGKLEVSYTPTNPEAVNLSWSSSDTGIVTVGNDGTITPKGVGQTTVTVKDSYTGLTASCTVTILDIHYGDVDDNGAVTVEDINLIVSHILGKNPSTFNQKKADINKDGKINVIDVTYAVDLALSESPARLKAAIDAMRSETRGPSLSLNFDTVALNENGEALIPFSFRSQDNLSAFQTDVQLPATVQVDEISLGNILSETHSLSFLKLDDNMIRIMIYSSSLAPLVSDNLSLKLKVSDEVDLSEESLGTASFTNTIASAPNGKGIPFDDFKIEISRGLLGGISGVQESGVEVSAQSGEIVVKTNSPMPVEVYTAAGTLADRFISTGVDSRQLVKGLYIVVVDGRSFKVMVF